MCLAIGGTVVSVNEDMAVIDYNGLRKQASTRLLPDTAVGDEVLVHAGFIIQKLNADEAAELAELDRELRSYGL
ncbi:MAG: HypC/HybG/HupF family hydrogenase formation chaperone [Bacillota bacterium]|nr:HypC/HybG/HupF family hydrogenase formation chaperone [Bacillota bacterium]